MTEHLNMPTPGDYSNDATEGWPFTNGYENLPSYTSQLAPPEQNGLNAEDYAFLEDAGISPESEQNTTLREAYRTEGDLKLTRADLRFLGKIGIIGPEEDINTDPRQPIKP